MHRIDGGDEGEALEVRHLEGKSTRQLQAVLSDTISRGGQLLVFVSSRSSAQKEARELSKHCRKILADGKEESSRMPSERVI